MSDEQVWREAQCGRKIRHPSRRDAARHRRHLARNSGETRGDIAIYLCPWCSWWHVGHRPGHKRKDNAA